MEYAGSVTFHTFFCIMVVVMVIIIIITITIIIIIIIMTTTMIMIITYTGTKIYPGLNSQRVRKLVATRLLLFSS